VRVDGDESVETATIVEVDENWQPIDGSQQTLAVDVVGLAVGLSPLAELAWMAGCRFVHVPELGGWLPVHDQEMQTSLPGLYVAGDVTGIEEASIAMEQGRMAGLAAAQALGHLSAEEAEDRKADVRRRLAALRVGSFGDVRADARKRILTHSAQGSG
jgi:thioredoxin reductase